MTTPHLYRDVAVATLDGSGSGRGRISNGLSTIIIVVQQLSLVTVPRLPGCTCEVSISGTNFVDTSYFAGTGDVAQGSPDIPLYPGDYIEMVWANGPPNGQGLGTYYYIQQATS